MPDTLNMGNDSTNTINVNTFKDIKSNGVIYKPEFESDGMKIPMVYASQLVTDDNGSHLEYKCSYLMIPKDEIMKILRDYMPEIIREFASSTDTGMIELLRSINKS